MGSEGPLSGIKVLDLSRLAPGPHCTMILGDLGAEVIRVDEPGPPTGRRAEQAKAAGIAPEHITSHLTSPFNALARNKRSIALNLKTQAGKEIYLRLAQRADVIVEEFRPGVAKRLGIDYETVSLRNPRVIYCAITGYGQTGPYRDMVGHDLNYIATAGALSVLGRPNQPPTIPHNLLADYAGGGMHAAIGILAALYARNQTGRGQYIDVAMMDGTMLVMAQTFSTYFATGRIPGRGEGPFDGGSPFYEAFLTKDDKYITIAAIEPWFFANLCKALGREDLAPLRADKARYPELRKAFEEIFRTKTRDEWFELLKTVDVCVGRMLTLDEVEQDPQVKARQMIVELETDEGQRVKQIGISLKFSATPGSVRTVAPKVGQHTDEILRELGYRDADIARWRELGAIK